MFRRLLASRLGRNSIYLCGSQFSLALLQGVLFLVLSRVLGPAEFGIVAGSLAFTAALLSLSGMGLGNVAMMRIARAQGRPSVYLGNALAVTTVTGSVAVLVAVGLATLFYGDAHMATVVAVFGVSELLFTKYIDLASQVFYGMEEHGVGVIFLNLMTAMRLVAAVGMHVFMAEPRAIDWAVLHLGSGIVTTAVLAVVTLRRIGRPELQWRAAWRDSLEGFFFAIGLSGRSVFMDADKAVLARHASLEASGAYTAAYRLVFMAYSPIMALILARQGNVYRAGRAQGLAGSFGALRQLAAMGAAYGAFVAVALYFGAGLLPLILGRAYAPASDVLRALCLLPLLFIAQSILSALLTGVDNQRLVAFICIATAAVSVGLNLLLVPVMSWHGSVAAAYGSQAFLVLALMLSVAWLRKQPRHAAGAPGELGPVGRGAGDPSVS
jgi:O-antigen/teichoic acid export membrane protein